MYYKRKLSLFFLFHLTLLSHSNAWPGNASIYIQSDSDHPSSPFISEIEHCREKCYRQKLYGFEGDIRWYHWFDLEELLDGHMKVIFIFCTLCRSNEKYCFGAS